LTAIPGFGPRKALLVYREVGVESVDGLLAAADSGQLATLKGFSAKTEDAVRRGAERLRTASERVLVSHALELAEDLIERLKALPQVHRIAFAGSLRRMVETIGDIDLLVASSDHDPIMRAFAELDVVDRVIARGDTKTSILTRAGLQVDLRVVPAEAWGAALIYFTGSKAHNIRIREMAVRKGLKLHGDRPLDAPPGGHPAAAAAGDAVSRPASAAPLASRAAAAGRRRRSGNRRR